MTRLTEAERRWRADFLRAFMDVQQAVNGGNCNVLLDEKVVEQAIWYARELEDDWWGVPRRWARGKSANSSTQDSRPSKPAGRS